MFAFLCGGFSKVFPQGKVYLQFFVAAAAQELDGKSISSLINCRESLLRWRCNFAFLSINKKQQQSYFRNVVIYI